MDMFPGVLVSLTLDDPSSDLRFISSNYTSLVLLTLGLPVFEPKPCSCAEFAIMHMNTALALVYSSILTSGASKVRQVQGHVPAHEMVFIL